MGVFTGSALCMEQQTVISNDVSAAQNMLKDLTVLPVRHEAPDDGKGYAITVLAGYMPDETFLQVIKARKGDHIEYRGCTFKDGETVRNPVTVDAQIFDALLEKRHSQNHLHILAPDYHFLLMHGRINDSGAPRWHASTHSVGGTFFAEKCDAVSNTFRAEVQPSGGSKIFITGEEARALFMTLAYCYTTGWYKKTETIYVNERIEYRYIRMIAVPMHIYDDVRDFVHDKYVWQEEE